MLEFREITNDDILLDAYINGNHEVWGQPLSTQQWSKLHELLHNVMEEYNLKCRYFGIVEGKSLLAACAVLDRPLYLAGGKRSTDHAIMGVHTSPMHRRKGYARQLIDGIVKVFSDKEDDQLSLWSDVKDYYARSGFKRCTGDKYRSLVLAPRSDTKSSCHFSTSMPVEWIDTPSMIENVREAHAKLLTSTADRLGGAVIEAGPSLYALNVAKSNIYKDLVGKERPGRFGAHVGDAWASWTYLFATGVLLIMGISGSSKETAELLRLAAETAERYGLKKVEIFETTLLDSDFNKVVDAVKKVGLAHEVEQERAFMQPMYIGKHSWVAPGGYAWC